MVQAAQDPRYKPVAEEEEQQQKMNRGQRRRWQEWQHQMQRRKPRLDHTDGDGYATPNENGPDRGHGHGNDEKAEQMDQKTEEKRRQK